MTDTAGDDAGDEDERLSLAPTPDDGVRLTDALPWDESARPHRRPAPAGAVYSRRGRLVGRHLIEVHDMFRRELTELRRLLA